MYVIGLFSKRGLGGRINVGGDVRWRRGGMEKDVSHEKVIDMEGKGAWLLVEVERRQPILLCLCMPGCEVEARHRKQEATKPELLAIKQYSKSTPNVSSSMCQCNEPS